MEVGGIGDEMSLLSTDLLCFENALHTDHKNPSHMNIPHEHKIKVILTHRCVCWLIHKSFNFPHDFIFYIRLCLSVTLTTCSRIKKQTNK